MKMLEFSLAQLHSVIAISKSDPTVLKPFAALSDHCTGSFNFAAIEWLAKHDAPPASVCEAGVGAWMKLCRWLSAAHVGEMPGSKQFGIDPFSLIIRYDMKSGSSGPEPGWEPLVDEAPTRSPISLTKSWATLLRTKRAVWNVMDLSPCGKDFYIHFRSKDAECEFFAAWSDVDNRLRVYGAVSSAMLAQILS